MSALTSYARLLAAESGRAQRLTTVRHVHLSEHPFAIVPLTLAGEACAPLAAIVGAEPAAPRLLAVPNPKDRTHRFRFVAELAAELLPYIEGCRSESEEYLVGRGAALEARQRAAEAPQLVVPNPGGINFLRLLGRSTRLRRTEGPFAVDPSVPRLGTWLTWLTERAEFAGSSVLISLTQQLAAHWATGQSRTEDGQLGTLLGWIDPGPDGDGYAAARTAEDPGRCPPAGPATDPVFDRTLSELYTRISEAPTEAQKARALRELRTQLEGQLVPVWDQVWRGIDLLRVLPPGGRVAKRWAAERTRFTGFAEYLDDGGLPQARRDDAASAARRLAGLEEAAQHYEYERAFDDPMVLAEYELSGDAFRGVVLRIDADRKVVEKVRPVLRPQVTLGVQPLREQRGPAALVGRALSSPARPKQTAWIIAVRNLPSGGWEVDLELKGGMGRASAAAPGSVPELGEDVCYSTLDAQFAQQRSIAPEDTPWTHGGPPTPYRATDEDADEVWE